MYQIYAIVLFLKILDLTIRILNKCFINTKSFEVYKRQKQLDFLFCNHDQRLVAISNTLRKFDLSLIKQFSVKKKNRFSNKRIKTFLYIGDSHVERYSRIWSQKKTDGDKVSHIGYWLGPWTLVSFLTKGRMDEFNEHLNKMLIKLTDQKIYLILSFGSIDVRTVYYELKLRKVIKNNKEYLDLIGRAFDELSSNIDNFKALHPNLIDVGFLELINSSLDGHKPKSIRNLLSIRKKEEFATFGDLSVRSKLTKQINFNLKEKCREQSIHWLSTKSTLPKHSTYQILFDGIHVEDRNLIFKINENIENEFN